VHGHHGPRVVHFGDDVDEQFLRVCGSIPECGDPGGFVERCTNLVAPPLDGGVEGEAYIDVATDAADGGSTICRPVMVERVQGCR